MIRLGVISDSHGAGERIKQAARALARCDATAFLGDGARDAQELSALVNAPVWTVRGNCDWLAQTPDKLVRDIAGIKVLLTHGHIYNVKHGLVVLSFAAREARARLALYGHTHRQSVDDDGEIIYLNPGALRAGQYALVEIENGDITPRLLTLN